MPTASTSHPTPRVRWAPPAPTARDLAGQLRDAVVDLPRFVTAPLARRRHRTWGATRAEVAAPMPGASLLPAPSTAVRGPSPLPPRPRRYGRGWFRSAAAAPAGTPTTYWTISAPQRSRNHSRVAASRSRSVVADAPQAVRENVLIVDCFVRPQWMLWRCRSRSWAWRLVPCRQQMGNPTDQSPAHLLRLASADAGHDAADGVRRLRDDAMMRECCAASKNVSRPGLRNLTNYIARSLLETGGFRPRLHPALVKSRSSWGSAKDATETGNQ